MARSSAPKREHTKVRDMATTERVLESSPVLSVSDLSAEFLTRSGWVRVLDGISFDVAPGGCLGLVGESGCGKSVTCLSIMRLLKAGQGRVLARSVLLDGEETAGYGEREMRRLRGAKISMILQDPMSSLNPTLSIGFQTREAVREDGRGASYRRAVDVLRQVRLSSPEERLHQYPHMLSGGMRQRVCIGMAIARRPRILFADEATTALDVTIQAQILNLLKRLRDEFGTAIVLVTHDFGVVAQTCDRVAVMYAGKIVETGSVKEVLSDPQHPYTQGLIASLPRIGAPKGSLHAMSGQPPDLRALPPGCRFEPRCPVAVAACREAEPLLLPTGQGRQAACWLRTYPPVALADG